MRISVTWKSNKFKMTNILLYIIEVMIFCIVASKCDCHYLGVAFQVGSSTFPEGKCKRLACYSHSGFYHTYGCPPLEDSECTKYAIDKSLPYPECCVIQDNCRICDEENIDDIKSVMCHDGCGCCGKKKGGCNKNNKNRINPLYYEYTNVDDDDDEYMLLTTNTTAPVN